MKPTPEVLEKYSLFGGLMSDQLEYIISLLQVFEFGSGEDLIKEGEVGDRMYCLLEGQVAVIKASPDQEPVQVATLGRGDTFGEMELIDTQARSATVRALTHCIAVSLSNKDLWHIKQRDSEVFTIILLNLTRDLSRRVRTLDRKLAEKGL